MYKGRGVGGATPEGGGGGGRGRQLSQATSSGHGAGHGHRGQKAGQGLSRARLPELQVRSDRRDGVAWSS